MFGRGLARAWANHAKEISNNYDEEYVRRLIQKKLFLTAYRYCDHKRGQLSTADSSKRTIDITLTALRIFLGFDYLSKDMREKIEAILLLGSFFSAADKKKMLLILRDNVPEGSDLLREVVESELGALSAEVGAGAHAAARAVEAASEAAEELPGSRIHRTAGTRELLVSAGEGALRPAEPKPKSVSAGAAASASASKSPAPTGPKPKRTSAGAAASASKPPAPTGPKPKRASAGAAASAFGVVPPDLATRVATALTPPVLKSGQGVLPPAEADSEPKP